MLFTAVFSSAVLLLVMAGDMQTPKLLISIQFLNELSTSEARNLTAHILSKNDYDSLINRKNLDDEITPGELQSFTSITAEDGESASHLCDVVGCIRDEHLTIEKYTINLSRISCAGLILTLKSEDASKPKRIMEIDSCPHGIDHPEADGDVLKFSCRKLQVLLQDEASSQHFKNLC